MLRSATFIVLSLAVTLTLCSARPETLVAANSPPPVTFNRDVRPILAEHCLTCHGFDQNKREAGLRLDVRETAAGLLESGARAIVPGDVESSELIFRITTNDPELRMPPAGAGGRLSAEQVDLLRRWIEQGAIYERHWAFIPPQGIPPPPAPDGAEGSAHPVDRFVQARLAREQITPSAAASRATLIRRVSLDLIGLPPTPSEVDAFMLDARPDAYQRIVDRLLDSQHFGERWARWWLDLAHYADSDGYLQDMVRPWAWRYRQWVVDSLNRDLPFDQFTIEQIAGDLLPEATPTQRVATGFLRNTLSNREGGADLEEFRVRQVIDRTVTVGTVWLGMTVGCAQCHDHKFDPISQREFYQLYAFFNEADEVNIDAPLPGDDVAAHRAAKAEYRRKRDELLAPVADQISDLQTAWEKKLLWTWAHPGEDGVWDRHLEILGLVWEQDQGGGQLEGLMIVRTPPERRSPDQTERLQDYFLKSGELIAPERFKELKLHELRDQLAKLAEDVPPLSRAPTMVRTPLERGTHIHRRGDFRQPGERVEAKVPAVLPPLASDASADRLELARWLVSPDHPLTARVTVNRLWQELFGRGLVSSSDNLGSRGARPTHPELLDWLAAEFAGNGWSLKRMLRLLVTSDTYRQSSHARPDLVERDPDNTLLARQSRLRLPGEAVRDVALAASGLLDRSVGGPSVRPPQPESVSKEGFDNKWETSTGRDRYRRGLYTFIQRTSPYAQFVTFDMPNTSFSCTLRERSNTPLQALNLLNDPVFVEAAQALARRVLQKSGQVASERIAHAYLLTLARHPSQQETERMTAYLAQQTILYEQSPEAARNLLPDGVSGTSQAEAASWVALASVLLNLDEFITRE